MAAVWGPVSLAIYGIGIFAGVMVSISRQNRALLLDREVRERERLVERAINEERQRLAGELHDVAAHHLAGIVVQAAAVGRLINRSPADAKEAAEQLRTQSKETLSGLRSVVGLLRSSSAPDPPHGLQDLPALVRTTQDLGVPTSLDAPPELPELPPVLSAAVYRVTLQAISNALPHAPGAALVVQVSEDARRLVVSVTNGPATSRPLGLGSGGSGLKVMRERAVAIGATVDSGPTSDGGWRITLTLPRPTSALPG
ncbi:MAG: histidine kinase [Propionibacteriaceae bacterium]|nr:histidine kinase [Propionibacteriaceae bacterium]